MRRDGGPMIALTPDDAHRLAAAIRFCLARKTWPSWSSERPEYERLLAELEGQADASGESR